MKNISSKDFDKKFDDAEEDILKYADKSSTEVFDTAIKKVNVDFPTWMIKALDIEAKRIGVTRQALIKTIVDNELKKRQVA
jgi:hypothetical protein